MNLRNKLAFFIALNSYVELITRGTSPLSLPKAVANSLSYVKAFGGTEQRNIPNEYTELEYLTSGTDGQYIDTGILFDPTKNFRVVGNFINPYATLRKIILGNYYSQQSETYYSIELYSDGKFRNYMSADGGSAFNIYSPTAVPADTIAYFDTSYDALAHQTTTTLRYGTTEQTYSGATPETTTVAVHTLKLFNDKRNLSPVYNYPVSIGAVQIYIDDILAHHYVPARRESDNVLGMYDTVSGTFFTNAGTGTFAAGGEAVPTPDTPMDIVSNNGVVKLSPNLVEFNETRINSTTWATANKTKGFEVNADVYSKSVGDQLFTNANCFGVFVPAKTNESVSLEFFDYSPDYTRCYYCEVTADGKCNTAPVSFASGGAISQQTFTLTQADSIGFVFEWYISAQQTRNYTKENYMIVRGTTPPTAYMPYGQIYTDGTVETIKDSLNNTATAEMLLKVGDYQDVQSIIDGVVTRNVGVMVLDGSEAWGSFAAGGGGYYLRVNDAASQAYGSGLCSHFPTLSTGQTTQGIRFGAANNVIYIYGVLQQFPTGADWFQYLADQYANGTPVIIVYPLATPTTESVAGQTLQVTAGDNVLEITQASLTGLELEAQYKKRK